MLWRGQNHVFQCQKNLHKWQAFPIARVGRTLIDKRLDLIYPLQLTDERKSEFYTDFLYLEDSNIFTLKYKSGSRVDAGVGQCFNGAPGSLVCQVKKQHIDPAAKTVISLLRDKVLPSVARIAESLR